ncbi:hypothetical protein C0J52_15718 [Blattella germanica]|nr:hypothetical protein C0J52_15718 [Blattella germanica]
MKFFLCLSVAVLAVAVSAAEDKKEDKKAVAAERPKTFKRLIPADVLRDFPGVCFASTKCATVEPGQTWELAPFCGRSTCVLPEGEDKNTGHLLELVEDCGPLPKPNPKCKLSEKTNKSAAFPDCCPIFECEDGAKLEYPEIPTVAPPAEGEKKDAKA